MSQINVNTIIPYSGTSVTVNEILMINETNKPFIIWNGFSNNQTSIGNGTTIIGEETMINNTGNANTAIGFGSSRDNTSGLNNTSIGHQSLYSNTVGSSNVAVGKDALYGGLSGSSNTSIGQQSLYVCEGSGNVGIGQSSGFGVTTGNNNTLVGTQAGNTITTGSNNIVIGQDSQPSSATVSNTVTLGNGLISTLRCAATSITSLSDKRDKKEIEPLQVGLDFINRLNPVTFVWDERDENGKHDIKDFGFIAQDLKKSQEDANLEETLRLVYEENPDKLEASYGKLIPILVKAIQDLSKEVDDLKNKLN